MALGYVTTLRNTMLNTITAAIDTGAGPNGKLRIYDGTRPATGGTATTLLAELDMSATSFAAASNGKIIGNTISDDISANATGTATWFRIVDKNGNAVLDGDVGTSGSDLNLNTTSITAGLNVSVTQFDITEGNP